MKALYAIWDKFVNLLWVLFWYLAVVADFITDSGWTLTFALVLGAIGIGAAAVGVHFLPLLMVGFAFGIMHLLGLRYILEDSDSAFAFLLASFLTGNLITFLYMLAANGLPACAS